jgi:glyoxylase-like metal-dependent hydrolase (beta-lactamase superfamily II)
MTLILSSMELGPWPMNSYIISSPDNHTCVIVDPGAEADKIFAAVAGKNIAGILVTHAHPDHIGALDEVKSATGAPVYAHPAESSSIAINIDSPLSDGALIAIGDGRLRAIHTPGHTPGMMCFDIGDERILVGDTIFVGGPGRTWSVADFAMTIRTMQEVVFRWPDQTRFFPGHGPAGRIGAERAEFQAFLEKGWSHGVYGDITWV